VGQKIDAVTTWVDGSVPTFENRFVAASAKARPAASADVVAGVGEAAEYQARFV